LRMRQVKKRRTKAVQDFREKATDRSLPRGRGGAPRL
jgi:hypothetical protein